MNNLVKKVAGVFLAVMLGSGLWFAYLNLSVTNFPNLALGEPGTKTSEDEYIDLEVPPAKSIFFTGDVMLARHVEHLMTVRGFDYPHLGQLPWTTGEDFVVGNFEAAIPLQHRRTPNFTFQFSVSEQFIPALSEAGFTHFSLANNHAFDYGGAGLSNTVNILTEQALNPFGHPSVINATSTTVIEVSDKRVGIIGLHTLIHSYTKEELQPALANLSQSSDLQIAYIHWGNEYELTPSSAQRQFARKLVALGIDLIIGHHPHVVQSVEIIDEVPVFYSLGNFIFDQYFSRDVQQGLVLELKFLAGTPQLIFWPVETLTQPAQPTLMAEEMRQDFLAELAERSDEVLVSSILAGNLTIPSALATSTENAIIKQ